MAKVRVWMDEALFERVTSSNPDLNKEGSLNNAVSVYLNVHEIVKKEYPNAPDDAIEDSIRTFLKIKKAVLSELAGVFSRAELVGLLDAFNGTMIQGVSIPPQTILLAQIEDAKNYDNSDTWHGYNTDDLLSKISKLTPIQAEIWLNEIIRFWQEGINLENFLNQYQQNV